MISHSNNDETLFISEILNLVSSTHNKNVVGNSHLNNNIVEHIFQKLSTRLGITVLQRNFKFLAVVKLKVNEAISAKNLHHMIHAAKQLHEIISCIEQGIVIQY